MGSRTFFAAAVLVGWLVSSTGYAQELPDDTRFDNMYGAVELAQEEDGGDLIFTEPAVDGESQEALPSAAICGYIGDVSGLGDAYGATVAAHVFANCARYDVDPVLALSLFQQESQFRMDACSPAGAIGLTQLMPDTAAGLGGDPMELEDNIRCGVEYLSGQLARFSDAGDLQATYAVAAYNAGPQRVLDYGDVPPYRETRNHVNAVAENYQTIYAILQNEA